ncbi:MULTISPECIES: hypothetical protein [unclassified Paenibacillus]|uniref:hypothetical protein n=1 Tax=unclassified Paenibacillus TaxID=185978 RepID=UPI00034E71D6|nr:MULTISPECIES: hypothetical protein [unclassified Paenibacillus]EPD92728.1 hypothetical protein HMPREF1207_00499 [Paenibacillus sp. HGH0039]
MSDKHPKGRVEFRQPPVKLTADLPGDPEMREHLDEMRANDGYPGSCGIINPSEGQGE